MFMLLSAGSEVVMYKVENLSYVSDHAALLKPIMPVFAEMFANNVKEGISLPINSFINAIN